MSNVILRQAQDEIMVSSSNHELWHLEFAFYCAAIALIVS